MPQSSPAPPPADPGFYRRITLPLAECAAYLAAGYSGQEAAATRRVPYNTIRTRAKRLRELTALDHSRDIARWWPGYRGYWLERHAAAIDVKQL